MVNRTEPRSRHGRALPVVGCVVLLVGCGAHARHAHGPLRTATSRDVELRSPSALALSPDGDLYVADFEANVVFRVDGNGRVTIAAGKTDPLLHIGVAGTGGNGTPAAGAPVSAPDGLALASNGRLFIAEHASNRIRYVDAAGVIHPFAGAGSTMLNGGSYSGDGGPATSAALDVPDALALGPDGALLIADRLNNRVRRVTPSGTITTFAGDGRAASRGDGGLATAASLEGPTALAVGAAGDVYIAEGHRVRRVDASGRISTVVRGLADPAGLAFARSGDLYVVDGEANRVLRVDVHGAVATVRAGPLDAPRSILVDDAGDIYVSDAGNSRVRLVEPDGQITTLLASPG